MRQPFGETLIAGDTWNWTVQLEGSSAVAGSTLKYLFRGPACQALDIAGTVASDGTCNFISPSSAGVQATTALAGSISWGLFLFDLSGNRTELARGTVTVLPDIETAGPNFDGRSWAKRTLDAVTNLLEGRASRVEKLYQVGGRHIELLTPVELLELKGNLQSIYDKELVRSGQKRPGGNQIRAAFGPRAARYGEWK
jgi:hypothetical protein